MWNNLLSVIKKIDFPSYLCEELCRFCGEPVPVRTEREMDLCMETPANGLIHAQLKTGPPGICLCTKCSEVFQSSRQSLWWLPGGTVDGVIKLLPVATGGMYEGAMQKLIRRLKYDDDRLVVQDISPLLVRAYETLSTVVPQMADKDNVILAPIPLHRKREHKRGYNQAFLLAKEVRKHTGVSANARILKRRKNTRPQYGLGKEERLRNIDDAFAMGKFDITGKVIVLVDDVFTSGATLITCASLLTAHGATAVAAVAAARAPYDKGG